MLQVENLRWHMQCSSRHVPDPDPSEYPIASGDWIVIMDT